MQAFRDLVRGWLGKFLLGLLMIPFAIVGIESYFVGGKAAPAATKMILIVVLTNNVSVFLPVWVSNQMHHV